MARLGLNNSQDVPDNQNSEASANESLQPSASGPSEDSLQNGAFNTNHSTERTDGTSFKDQARSMDLQHPARVQAEIMPDPASRLPTYKDQIMMHESELSSQSIDPIVNHRPQQQLHQPPQVLSSSTEHESSIIFADAQLVDVANLHNSNNDNNDGDVLPAYYIPSPDTEVNSEDIHSKKRNVAYASLVLLLIVTGAVVGSVCGTGGCSSSSTSSATSTSNTTPSSSPIAVTAVPTVELTPAPTTAAPSNMPSFAPTFQSNNTELFTILNSVTLSDVPIRSNYNITIEERAAQWLVHDISRGWSGSLIRLIQRYALATIWFSLNGTTQWRNNTGWVTGVDECTWFGVTCDDNNTAINQIDLKNNELHGELPTDIGLLNGLIKLDFTFNPKLTGSLPASIGNLRQLELLSVERCTMDGSMPSTIGQLNNLNTLSLRDNRFSGTLPSEIGGCTSLQRFWLNQNTFSGTLPNSIGQLKNLVAFIVHTNTFNGTIPEAIGQWPDQLEEFILYNNNFSGPLPSTIIGEWTNLTTFDIANNQLTGRLPTEIGYLTRVTYFHSEFNKFNGPIPQEIGNMSMMKEFFLNDNSFTGTIPDTIANWIDINDAHFERNNLNGQLPSIICNATKLRTLEADCLVQISCACCSRCY